jgi:hypothetical protein
MRSKLTYGNIMATVAVFLALGGTALASIAVSSNADIAPDTVSGAHPPSGDHSNIIASSITGADIKNGSLSSSDIHDKSLTGDDVADNGLAGDQIDESTLGAVPHASYADHADDADGMGGVSVYGWQRRVPDSCSGPSAISAIAADGSIVCTDPPVGAAKQTTMGSISVSAHGCAQVSIPGANLQPGESAIVAPDAAKWPSALMLMPLRAASAGLPKMVVCNPTNSAASSPNGISIAVWPLKAS